MAETLRTFSKTIDISHLMYYPTEGKSLTDELFDLILDACRDICKTATFDGTVKAYDPEKVIIQLPYEIYDGIIEVDQLLDNVRKYFERDHVRGRKDFCVIVSPSLLRFNEARVYILFPKRVFGQMNLLPAPTNVQYVRKYPCESNKICKIKKVIFNPPATVVYWSDGSKTVSKVQNGDTWDSEKGLAMAIIKKTIGLKEFNKHIDEHAVNADFWHYATSEVLAKKSVDELGFKPHMDAIVSRYGTDLVKRYLKSVEENGMEEVCQE